jgi:hypothetical protein
MPDVQLAPEAGGRRMALLTSFKFEIRNKWRDFKQQYFGILANRVFGKQKELVFGRHGNPDPAKAFSSGNNSSLGPTVRH